MDAPLNLVIVGHVDHGKSTLIGRLLHETGSLPDGKLDELIASSARRGVEMEWSFVLDALQAERDQAITIDTTRIWLRAGERRYAIIDAPGHRQFISNMMSGAAEADAAVLMVDVTEGVSEQTRRHAYLLQLLGIEQIVVAINKMDALGFARAAYDRVAADARAHLAGLGLRAAAIVPISARSGDQLVTPSAALAWYDGPTLLGALEPFSPQTGRAEAALRLRVQDVYRTGTTRIAVGRIDTGTLRTGDTIVIAPTGSRARVTSIERWPVPGPPVARAGESIGLTIDQPVYIERGNVIGHPTDPPLRAAALAVTLFWMDERGPEIGETFRLQLGPTEARVTVEAIERIINTETLAVSASTEHAQHSVFELRLRAAAMMPLDTRERHPLTARCVLLRGSDVAAGGFVSRVLASAVKSTNITRHDHLVTREERNERNGHRGAVIWLTGLSGSGKSTLAMALERRLFVRGMSAYVLDGDNVRSGLNRDLGFSPEDRTENIRRIAEVAALFADAGTIVITAFISPSAADRSAARMAAGEAFHEVHVSADLATCEARDPKGLYARARRGEIQEFTGISAPYDVPSAPDLTIDSTQPLDACIEQLVEYAVRATAIELVPLS